MTPFDTNLKHLAIARDILLTPFGLDEAKLNSALKSMFSHKIDYADMYFQFTKNEGWSLEEGIVKTGSFSIDQGVGVRAVSGDKAAFSYSDEISEHALLEAAAATRTIARAGAGKIKVANSMHGLQGHQLYLQDDPLASLDANQKVALLEKIEKIAEVILNKQCNIQINKLYYSRANGSITCIKFSDWVNYGTYHVSKGWKWLSKNK